MVISPVTYTAYDENKTPLVFEGFPPTYSGDMSVRLTFKVDDCEEAQLDTTLTVCKGIGSMDLDLGCESDFRLTAGTLYNVELGQKVSETDIYDYIHFNLFVSHVL